MYNLKNLLIHAIETVPFYNDLELLNDVNEFYEIFPEIKRNNLSGSETLFLSSKFRIEDLTLHTTSGSTGIPIRCYKSNTDLIRMGRHLWKERNKHGKVNPRDKYVTFFIRRYNKDKSVNNQNVIINKNNLSLNLLDLSLKNIKDYCRAIHFFQPKWIFGPPSALNYISRYILQSNEKYDFSSLKFIELTGEFCLKEQQDYISLAFDTKVTNMYGSKETWLIAYSCPNGHLHLCEDNVYCEINNNNELLLTGLNNYSMPLIKYNIGDSVEWVAETECTFSGRMINILAGRSSSYIRVKGRFVSIAVFFLALNDTHRTFPGAFIQFQIQRTGEENFKFLFIRGKGFKEEALIKYEENIKKELDIQLNFEETDFINLGKNGKLSYFIEIGEK